MKKIIIFDFDGTIADTLKVALKIVNDYLKKEHYQTISAAELKQLRNMNPLQLITHFKFPLWKVPSLLKHVRNELAKEVDKVKIFPGVEKLIINLKLNKFHLAILSSNLKETVDKFLALHQLPLFDYIMCEPNIFEKGRLLKSFLKEHDLKTKDIIYIGDEVRDIEACKNVGIPIIAVTWGFNDKNALLKMKPDFVAQKPQQILSLLKKI